MSDKPLSFKRGCPSDIHVPKPTSLVVRSVRSLLTHPAQTAINPERTRQIREEAFHMSDQQPPKYCNHSDRDRQHEIELNPLGFIPWQSLDWPTPNASYLVRMLGRISEQMSSNHPGDVELYQRLISEMSRLGRKLPESTTKSDVYNLLQSFTADAIEMVEQWRQAERFVGPSEPVRSATVHRPTHRRAKRQPNVLLDAMDRRVAREHEQEINDTLAAM